MPTAGIRSSRAFEEPKARVTFVCPDLALTSASAIMQKMPKLPKNMKISFPGNSPMKFEAQLDEATQAPGTKEHKICKKLGKVVRAYLDASAELLRGKYQHLRSLAPPHLVSPGNVLVAICEEGAVIRYEKADICKVASGIVKSDLATTIRTLSQNLIICRRAGEEPILPGTDGIELRVTRRRPATGEIADLFAAKIQFDTVITAPSQRPQPPAKPYCMLSVRNSFDFELCGDLSPDNAQGATQFVARSTATLPVGWECIEVFPFLDIGEWKPEYARAWAEVDVLASVASQQVRDRAYLSLDPMAEGRRQYANVLQQFRELLDSQPKFEQSLQSFLQKNPFLLCPTKTKMWPKLSLGAKETDFVFCDASQDYLLIEIEPATEKMFNKNGDRTARFNHAIKQIEDWKRYIEDNLRAVQCELGLTGISANPRSILVMGRSSELGAENRRSLSTTENQCPKLRLMTYDDVYENAKSLIENLFGPIWEATGDTRIYYIKKAESK
jgi:Domain of unknown function (DUF4263)